MEQGVQHAEPLHSDGRGSRELTVAFGQLALHIDDVLVFRQVVSPMCCLPPIALIKHW